MTRANEPAGAPRIAVVGEALIDFTAAPGAALAFEGHPGGAPANSAIAAARLGVATAFIGQLSTDLFGERLHAHLAANAVDLRFVLRDDAASSTLAFVERHPDSNRYAFYTQGTADTRWCPAELPVLPQSCRWLHFGSVALLGEPAGSRITQLVEAEHGRRIVMFDPNARPDLLRDPTGWRARCGHWIALTDLLKLSEEDLAVLAPGQAEEAAIGACLARGPRAVVLTRGARGATLFRRRGAALHVRPPAIRVVDTIGAGDTFGAALMVALLDAGVQDAAALEGLGAPEWHGVLAFAAAAAACNCAREGADPPRRAEIDALLARDHAGL